MISSASAMVRVAHYIGGAGELAEIEKMCETVSGEVLLDLIYATTEHIPIELGLNEEYVRWVNVLNTVAKQLKPDGTESFQMLLATFAIIRALPMNKNYPFENVLRFWIGFREFCVHNRALAS